MAGPGQGQRAQQPDDPFGILDQSGGGAATATAPAPAHDPFGILGDTSAGQHASVPSEGTPDAGRLVLDTGALSRVRGQAVARPDVARASTFRPNPLLSTEQNAHEAERFEAERNAPRADTFPIRVATGVAEGAYNTVRHPVQTAKALYEGTVGAAGKTYLHPVEGDVITPEVFASRARVGLPSLPIGTVVTKENTPNAISRSEFNRAALQTGANVVSPLIGRGTTEVAERGIGALLNRQLADEGIVDVGKATAAREGVRRGAERAGRIATAGTLGAANNPEHPLEGAATFIALEPVFEAGGKVVKGAATVGGRGVREIATNVGERARAAREARAARRAAAAPPVVPTPAPVEATPVAPEPVAPEPTAATPAPVAREESPTLRRRIAEGIDPTISEDIRRAEANPITGLPGRAPFNRALASVKGDPAWRVVRFDINGTKSINDALGHPYTDEHVFQGASAALTRAAADMGVPERVFHLSGDEFAAIVPAEKADAFRQRAQELYGVREHGQGLKSSLSGGVGATEAEADAAAYRQKAVDKAAQGIAGRTSEPVSDIRAEPVENIEVSPEELQYKTGANERGVVKPLEGPYNRDLAGVLLVWRDPATGRLKLVNGHHRFDLAVREGAKRVDVREIQAGSIDEARTIGALTNIAENHGTALDAARLFREAKLTPDEIRARGVPIGGKLMQQGVALSKLASDVYDRVRRGEVPEEAGVAIGKVLDTPEQQRAALTLIQRSGKRLTPAEMENVARQVRDAGSESITQESLFGTEETALSLAVDKARLGEAVKKDLMRDKRIFGFVSKEGRAEELARGGNVINAEESSRLAEESANASEIFDRLASRAGPINDILTEGARRIARGEKLAAVKADIAPRLREAVQAALEGREGASAGRGGGAVPERAPERAAGTTEAAEPKAVGAQHKGELSRGLTYADVLDMSPDELERHASAAREADKNIEVAVFGEEGAKRYKAAQRIVNSTYADPRSERYQTAERVIGEMESGLTPAQQRRLFGIGQTGYNAEDLREIAEAARDYSPEHASDISDDRLIATIGREMLTGHPDKNAVSAIRLRGAIEEARRRGASDESLVRAVATYAERSGVSPSDAAELFHRTLNDLGRARPPQGSSGVPQLGSGAPAAEGGTGLRFFDENGNDTTAPYSDPLNLFGEEEPSTEPAQGTLFGGKEGTEQSRNLSQAEAAARAELPKLREQLRLEKDPTRRASIAGRIAKLERLVNRGEKISADEMGTRAAAGENEPAPPSEEGQGALFSRTAPNGGARESVRRAYLAGRREGDTRGSIIDRKRIKFNPYRPETPEHAAFEQGFDEAYDPTEVGSGLPEGARLTPQGDIALSPEQESARRENVAESEITRSASPQRHDARFFDENGNETSELPSPSTEPAQGELPGMPSAGDERAAGEAAQGKQPATNEPIPPQPKTILDTLKRWFSPASRTPHSRLAADVMRAHFGEFAREMEQAQESMKALGRRFNKMSKPERLDFIHRMETGARQRTGELDAMATVLRRALDDARRDVQSLGTGKLEAYIEHYFPHIWEEPGKVRGALRRVLGRRPLEGPKSFLKRRTIPTLKDGIDAGLVPVTTNPVDLTLLKLREMRRYIMAQRILADLKQRRLVRFVNATDRAPEGYRQIDDRIGTVYGKPTVEMLEVYDKQVMEKLTKILGDLGIQHTRKVNIGTPPSGGVALGFANEEGITTRVGTPHDVLIHELGHALDRKYGLWDKLTKNGPKGPGNSDPTVREELNALADLRVEGVKNVPADFRAYIRNRFEQMAVSLQALLYAPERMAEVAPTVKARLEAFLASRPELAPLLEVKPSLMHGVETHEIPVGGLVIRGHYYGPEPVTTLLNNHLAPGLAGNAIYDAYRAVGNVMNQAQLGLSAFHLGFTSLDAAISKAALGVMQLADGRPVRAIRSIAEVPLAPLTNLLRGDKVLKAYLRPGTQSGEFGAMVDALVQGGGRVRMDRFYTNSAASRFLDALRDRRPVRAVALALPAALEAAAKPIFEYVVPRQKLGVFADLARYELERLPRNATPDAVRRALARAWDSVDNRMGELVYDNLFWHRALKDLAFASVRAVGWNFGSIRELGGGAADYAKMAARAAKGERVEMTPRMAYVVALPMTVGLIGGITTYLMTGQRPSELKDYFFPRTGRIDADGNPERVSLPSYMKDIFHAAHHPVQAVSSKMHPLVGLVSDMFENRDFFGNMVRNPDDPITKQLQQEAEYVVDQFVPFGVQNFEETVRRGEPPKAGIPSFVGVTPAPREEVRTDAQNRIIELLGRRGTTAATPEQQEATQSRRALTRDVRAGKPGAQARTLEAFRSGALTKRQTRNVIRSRTSTPWLDRFKMLTVTEALDVWARATPAERRQWRAALLTKIRSARQNGQRVAIPESVRHLVSPEPAK